MGCHVTVSMFLPDDLIATVRERFDLSTKEASVHALAALLQSCSGPAKRAEVRACIASAAASQTITCDQSAAANDVDTLTIAGGTALAVKATPANENQVSKGSSDAEFAANVAAKINAHSVHSKLVFAVVTDSDGGEITLFSLLPGPLGNKITLAEAGDGFTLTGAALAGGASDEVDTYQLGYSISAAEAG